MNEKDKSNFSLFSITSNVVAQEDDVTTLTEEDLKNERQKEELESFRQDREQRKTFSYCIFGFMSIYMIIVLIIVFLTGFNVLILSDTVLVTLLSTTLANVIGVFTFVAKYLFHFK